MLTLINTKYVLLSLLLLLSFSISPVFANEIEDVDLQDKDLELEDENLKLEDVDLEDKDLELEDENLKFEDFDLDNLDRNELSTLVKARNMHKKGTAEYERFQNKINEYYESKVKDKIPEPFETEEKEAIADKQYVISGIVGTAMPFGQNLKSNYVSGFNLGIRVNTPIYFFVGPLELNVGGDIYFLNMKSKGSHDNYTLTNFVGSLSTTLLDKINVRAGAGLSPTNDGTYLSMTVDVSYEIPLNEIFVNIEPISLTANLHVQETLGVPLAGEGTSDILGFSLVVGYPITF